MLYGIGVDILEISRMEKSVKSDRFMKRVFSREEIAMFQKRKNPVQTITANFCGKEAFSKAVGTGVRGFGLNEVSVLRDSTGKPFIKLHGKAEELYGHMKFMISISHTREYATAFVAAEKGDED